MNRLKINAIFFLGFFLSACNSDVMVTEQHGSTKTLSFHEDNLFRVAGNKAAQSILPNAADEECPNGWEKLGESSHPINDGTGNREHKIKIKCFEGNGEAKK